jgi:hypothetical protein
LRLFGVEEVTWLRDSPDWDAVSVSWTKRHADPIWRVEDDKYFIYGDKQKESDFRVEYLPGMLVVSDQGYMDDWIYLNPQVQTPTGEWEVWRFAPGLPGAERHRSFWDWIQYDAVRMNEYGW